VAPSESESAGGETTDPYRRELVVGAIVVGWSVLTALMMAAFPGPTSLDRWGFAAVARSARSTTLIHITELGKPAVLIVGALLAALVAVGRDRPRALSCVTGPLVTVLLVEYVFKPLVGRHFEGVLSYPSGSVADIAALATVWTLAVPRRVRPVVGAIGALAILSMTVAVIGLRWHYPTDAVGGAVLGVGTVLLVDGILHHPRISRQRWAHTGPLRRPHASESGPA